MSEALQHSTSVPRRCSSVRIASTEDECKELRRHWSAWCQHPSCDIDYFLRSTRVHPTVVSLKVMVVDRDGDPDCILIGRLLHEKLQLSVGTMKISLGKVRVIRFLSGGFLGTQSAGNTRLLVERLLDELKRGEADIVELRGVPVDSPLYESALRPASWSSKDLQPVGSPHYRLRIPDNAAEFCGRLPRKTRQQLARQNRRFDSEFAGNTHVECVSSPEQLEYLLDMAKSVSRESYQSNIGTGFTDTLAIREELRFELLRKRLRGYFLFADGKPCAFLIGKNYKGTYYVRFMGYHPDFSRFSPGLLLLQQVVSDIAENKHSLGVRYIDLGTGDLRYKRNIADERWDEATIHIFARSPKALSVKLAKSTILVLYRSVKYAIDHTQYRDTVARKWRHLLAWFSRVAPDDAQVDSR